MRYLKLLIDFCTSIFSIKINLYGYNINLFNALCFAFVISVLGWFIFRILK